jgi:hypothetical protein
MLTLTNAYVTKYIVTKRLCYKTILPVKQRKYMDKEEIGECTNRECYLIGVLSHHEFRAKSVFPPTPHPSYPPPEHLGDTVNIHTEIIFTLSS